MSDGPHRSLPMRRYWKQFAQRMANSAFSVDERNEALDYALLRDFKGTPRAQVREVLLGTGQGQLFSDQEAVLSELKRIAQQCEGNHAAQTLVSSAIQALHEGRSGIDALNYAECVSADEVVRAQSRGIEEHYYRNTSVADANTIRDRLDQIRIGRQGRGLPSSSADSHANGPRVRQRTGLDEGPPL